MFLTNILVPVCFLPVSCFLCLLFSVFLNQHICIKLFLFIFLKMYMKRSTKNYYFTVVALLETLSSSWWPSSDACCNVFTAFCAERFFLYSTKPYPIDKSFPKDEFGWDMNNFKLRSCLQTQQCRIKNTLTWIFHVLLFWNVNISYFSTLTKQL